MKRIKLLIIKIINLVKYLVLEMKMKFSVRKKIKILNLDETLNLLVNEKGSLCRFGDGEMDIIFGGSVGYQKHDTLLAKRLTNILLDKNNLCLIGVPDAINGFDNLTKESKRFWVNNMYKFRDKWVKLLSSEITYVSANVTRLYIRYQDKNKCKERFAMFKKIWNNRDIVIVEGAETRFGVGNDLLDNANIIKRVLCPAKDAFDKYDILVDYLKSFDNKPIFLICLGPTATVLAYDLANYGYQALDIGHLDIEYEWLIKGTTEKVKVTGKYTNEVTEGDSVVNIDNDEYYSQIIKVL